MQSIGDVGPNHSVYTETECDTNLFVISPLSLHSAENIHFSALSVGIKYTVPPTGRVHHVRWDWLQSPVTFYLPSSSEMNGNDHSRQIPHRFATEHAVCFYFMKAGDAMVRISIYAHVLSIFLDHCQTKYQIGGISVWETLMTVATLLERWATHFL